MNAEFGPLRPQDRQRFRDMLRYCFILTEEQVWNWVGDDLPDDWLIAGYAGDDLLTGAIVQPMAIMGTMQASVGAIGGVATVPHARGKGLARGLMEYALNILREKRIPWAILHPFDFGFYHRLGWGQGTPMVKMSLKDLRLLRCGSPPGSYRLVGTEMWESLDLIHRIWALAGSGSLVRGQREWSRLLHRPVAPRTCAVWESGGDAGYVVYELKRSTGASRLDGTCTVHDWAWTAPTAREALLSYLANHAGQVGRIDLKVSVDDPLANLEGEGVEKALTRGPMVRLVDVSRYDPCASRTRVGTLAVHVRDPLCAWNDGSFRLGVAEVSPGAVADDPHTVDLDIAVLSSLLWGSLSPETARRCGLIRHADTCTMDLLDSLVPRSPPFFLDWF